ncbi:5-oxoprolinase/urea amidolyase family protein [Cellulomonas fimi]|uniref:5-oxoprolinase subunit B/C family protein n=1 Tax=Cellulomonas fimi TaxID=1708 RepID=UPI0028930FA4|nr:5-oxoprolinase/urea amidolyase family protein [Cellulomonas fimi]
MSARRTVRRVGDRALLVECADLDEVVALHARLVAAPLDGQGDVLAAARTVLVRLTTPTARARVARALAELPADRVTPRSDGRLVTVDTVYDGADLADVAQLTGLSPEGVVDAHTGQVWTAAFGGFAPGFAYLVGENDTLDVPRRRTPRTAVPAGSVALAGNFSAIYPRESPGGWQLVGRTGERMWDLDRDPPALVRPGDRVRYRAVREVVTTTAPAGSVTFSSPLAAPAAPSVAGFSPRRAAAGPHMSVPALVVVSPGVQTLVEDLGRPGLFDLGVSPSGALDRGAAARANRLVGNPRGAAVLETVPGGVEFGAAGDLVLAVTGAPAPLTVRTPDGGAWHPPPDAPFALRDGETLTLEVPAAGLRSYVAVRGGLDAVEVLGSRATDVMSGIGPAPLVTGDALPIADPRPRSVVAAPEVSPRIARGTVSVAVVPGPRDDWFTEEARCSLVEQDWTVTDRSNRIGLRLDGRPLERAVMAQLPSEGTIAGAIQVPASGLPVVFLADHPVSGGYPVIGVVSDADLDRLAQARPGDVLRFVPADEPTS